MKKLLSITFFVLFVCCKQPAKNIDKAAQQARAQLAMEEKVNKVAQQLKADCDSNLLRLATIKEDSVLKSRKHKRHNLVTGYRFS